MPYFRVHLNGDNFWLLMEGKPTRLGFLTSRFVEAADESQAELEAVQLLRDDAKLSAVLNDRTDPPTIHCEGVESVEPFEPASIVQSGLIFYPAESQA
jgi:hypothetical protein